MAAGGRRSRRSERHRTRTPARPPPSHGAEVVRDTWTRRRNLGGQGLPRALETRKRAVSRRGRRRRGPNRSRTSWNSALSPHGPRAGRGWQQEAGALFQICPSKGMRSSAPGRDKGGGGVSPPGKQEADRDRHCKEAHQNIRPPPSHFAGTHSESDRERRPAWRSPAHCMRASEKDGRRWG